MRPESVAPLSLEESLWVSYPYTIKFLTQDTVQNSYTHILRGREMNGNIRPYMFCDDCAVNDHLHVRHANT